MNWEALSAIAAVVVAAALLANYTLVIKLQAEISNLALTLERQRNTDREELRDWINGSFMRAKDASASLERLDNRVNRLEQNNMRPAHGD